MPGLRALIALAAQLAKARDPLHLYDGGDVRLTSRG